MFNCSTLPKFGFDIWTNPWNRLSTYGIFTIKIFNFSVGIQVCLTPPWCLWFVLDISCRWLHQTMGPQGQQVSEQFLFFNEHWFGIVNQIKEGNHINIYPVMKNYETSVYFNYFITVREMQWIILFKNKRQRLYVYFSVS